jgi:hypothetical protein
LRPAARHPADGRPSASCEDRRRLRDGGPVFELTVGLVQVLFVLAAVAVGLIVEYIIIRGAVKDAIAHSLYEQRERIVAMLREADGPRINSDGPSPDVG